MSLKGRLEEQRVIVGPTPAQALSLLGKGNLVAPPTAGPMKFFPPWMDPRAFFVFHEEFLEWRASGTDVGGWDVDDIANGFSDGPKVQSSYGQGGSLQMSTDDTAVGDGAA